MIETDEQRALSSRLYLLATDDVEREIMRRLAAQIDEGARELCLRNGSVSLEVARIFLIRAVVQHLMLNLIVEGRDRDIEGTALYMARRATYGVQSNGYTRGGTLNGKEDPEDPGDHAEGVPALRAHLVPEDAGLPGEVREPEVPESVLGEAEADSQERGAAARGAS